MRFDYDTIIIGGGHNGLVCAAYLARAGQRVLVVEKRPILGGAAVTEEFHPGFRNSSCSYTVSLLNPTVMAELNLADHGLTIIKRQVNNIFPDGGGGGLVFSTKTEEKTQHFASIDTGDAEALARFDADIDRAADSLKRLLLTVPPSPKGGLKDLFRAIRLGLDLHGQTIKDQRLLMALATESVADFLGRYFTSDAIKAGYAFDGVVGTFASPYQPGTAYILLHHAFGEATGEPGVWGHAVGGMGAISDAIWSAAEAAGATAITGCGAQSIALKNGRAAGVVLDDGRTLTSRRVVCGTTPHVLFDRLLPKGAVDTGTHAAFTQAHYGSGTLRINVALNALPQVRGFESDVAALTSGIVLAPTMRYLEAAYLTARQQGYSARPIVEMLIPSTLDASLAPRGKHVASLFCQHVDYDALKADPGLKDKAVEAVVETVEHFAPGFRDLILGMRVLSPLDLEAEYGLTRGDIFHGQLSLGQLFSARPVLGHSGYKMPVAGLYLCGSGAHPGGGVSGVPGHNCAKVILGRL